MKDKYLAEIGHIEEGVAEVKHSNKRKSILMIGDSICRGYSPFVREEFKGKFDVIYPADNCRNSQYIITTLLTWVNEIEDKQNVEVVTFNCGHWDIAHWNGDEEPLTSIAEYEGNIKKIIRQIKKFFPNAKTIFFTTTPMSPDYNMDSINPRSNDEIKRYNAVAVKVVKESGVYIENLFSYMEDWTADKFMDYAHLTPDANKELGKHISDIILKVLKGE